MAGWSGATSRRRLGGWSRVITAGRSRHTLHFACHRIAETSCSTRCVCFAPVPNLSSLAPPRPLQALHQRLEPLLLFTIDGANFIDDEDRQWELLLPVARAADGGCLVVSGGSGARRGVGREHGVHGR